MSQITGVLSITGLSSFQSISGADVTPDAVNWGNMNDNGFMGTTTFREQQITGIAQQITLRVKTTSSCAGFIYYRVSNTSSGFGDGVDNDVGSYAYQADVNLDGSYLQDTCCLNTTGFTISVSNNQYVGFAVAYGDTSPITVQVVNESDGSAVLDSFTVLQVGV